MRKMVSERKYKEKRGICKDIKEHFTHMGNSIKVYVESGVLCWFHFCFLNKCYWDAKA